MTNTSTGTSQMFLSFLTSQMGTNEYSTASLLTATTIAAVFVHALLRIYNRFKPYAVDKSLPGPERHPFLGILVTLFYRNRGRMPEALHELSEKYQCTWGGPLPRIGAMGGSYFCTVEAKNIQHILSGNFDNYEKSDRFHNLFRELLGNGIFGVDGATWYRHRKIASHMFSTNLLREAAKVTLTNVQELSTILKDTQTTGKEVDVQDLFFRMTFDVTSVVAFGTEYGSLKNETQHAFAQAFDEMQLLLVQRVPDLFFELKRVFNIGQRERRIRELKVILDDNAKEIIQGRRRTAKDGKLGPDLLSRFIDYADKNNDPISDEELRDVIMNFMAAGRDTTAVALSWSLFELCKHPEVVEKMLEEANEVCGRVDDGNAGDYSYDNIGKLKYIDAVVMEVLRLYPSVPVTVKYAVNDDVLPDGTFIPKGAMVPLSPRAVGRSHQVWGSDASEFKPTRFLNQKEPTAFKYITFNAGKRLCLGKPMALNTLKLTLAYLIQRFEFEDIQGHDGVHETFTMIRKMKGGFPTKATLRQS
ncbi:Leukotriene-B(4) omega-hydroxylase 2 [Seminavis robusta]|uniref:Leukotriene-B(4) omega-hydroxylase 2 n=1 Tax=Seminavis robusta TaxID=568900 RepID=A0A9N8HBB4_9STRA|nr:Leukotriene-B(4) omega-hydroxylase 2 [Seminavis robusta]|eukprot:Sro255_g100330.1 Leukotriene-B(4) omega-hydroxylase 2 (530) ;mRNA; f:22102-23691